MPPVWSPAQCLINYRTENGSTPRARWCWRRPGYIPLLSILENGAIRLPHTSSTARYLKWYQQQHASRAHHHANYGATRALPYPIFVNPTCPCPPTTIFMQWLYKGGHTAPYPCPAAAKTQMRWLYDEGLTGLMVIYVTWTHLRACVGVVATGRHRGQKSPRGVEALLTLSAALKRNESDRKSN